MVTGAGYAQAEHPVSTGLGHSEQPWSGYQVTGRGSWGAEALFGGYSAVQDVDDEAEASAAALLMALQSG